MKRKHIERAVENLIKKQDLQIDYGDCLDIAVAVALTCEPLGLPWSIHVLQRFSDGEREAVIHAACMSGKSSLGAAMSDMADLEEHQTYLEEEDNFTANSARYNDDEELAEEYEARYYETLVVEGGVPQAELFRILSSEFEHSLKNNRKEYLFNPQRALSYATTILEEIQSLAPARTASRAMSLS